MISYVFFSENEAIQRIGSVCLMVCFRLWNIKPILFVVVLYLLWSDNPIKIFFILFLECVLIPVKDQITRTPRNAPYGKRSGAESVLLICVRVCLIVYFIVHAHVVTSNNFFSLFFFLVLFDSFFSLLFDIVFFLSISRYYLLLWCDCDMVFHILFQSCSHFDRFHRRKKNEKKKWNDTYDTLVITHLIRFILSKCYSIIIK